MLLVTRVVYNVSRQNLDGALVHPNVCRTFCRIDWFVASFLDSPISMRDLRIIRSIELLLLSFPKDPALTSDHRLLSTSNRPPISPRVAWGSRHCYRCLCWPGNLRFFLCHFSVHRVISRRFCSCAWPTWCEHLHTNQPHVTPINVILE